VLNSFQRRTQDVAFGGFMCCRVVAFKLTLAFNGIAPLSGS